MMILLEKATFMKANFTSKVFLKRGKKVAKHYQNYLETCKNTFLFFTNHLRNSIIQNKAGDILSLKNLKLKPNSVSWTYLISSFFSCQIYIGSFEVKQFLLFYLYHGQTIIK
jgi:hypothetical protein